MDILTEIEKRPAPVTKPRRPIVRWTIMLGDGSGKASQRLWSAAQAKRFVRLAKRIGVDVYATRFGRA